MQVRFLRTWFTANVGLMVELYEFEGVFQPKLLYDSVMLLAPWMEMQDLDVQWHIQQHSGGSSGHHWHWG